ncbi:MAG TPA: squalene synthase HpnC [Jatrophihabitans sp.]
MTDFDLSSGTALSVSLDELRRVAAVSHAQMSAENFPVALRLLPKVPRDAVTRVYAYARFVDDVGDEARGDRLALLDIVERDLRAVPNGRAELAPVQGLQPLVRGGLELAPFLDLIEANRLDQRKSRYADFDDLLEYCRLSAAPVGRIVLGIAGVRDDELTARSDAVCTALQVLEHCQDVGEDARAGRVYLPSNDLAGASVTDAELTADSTSPALRRVVALQVRRADELLAAGPGLVRALHGWARVAVAGYVAGGRATSKALTRAHCEVLAGAVHPSSARTAWYAVRLWSGR